MRHKTRKSRRTHHKCPSCKAVVGKQATTCIMCGYDFMTKKAPVKKHGHVRQVGNVKVWKQRRFSPAKANLAALKFPFRGIAPILTCAIPLLIAPLYFLFERWFESVYHIPGVIFIAFVTPAEYLAAAACTIVMMIVCFICGFFVIYRASRGPKDILVLGDLNLSHLVPILQIVVVVAVLFWGLWINFNDLGVWAPLGIWGGAHLLIFAHMAMLATGHCNSIFDLGSTARALAIARMDFLWVLLFDVVLHGAGLIAAFYLYRIPKIGLFAALLCICYCLQAIFARLGYAIYRRERRLQHLR